MIDDKEPITSDPSDILSGPINYLIDKRLNDIHTVLPATVLLFDGYAAKIQINAGAATDFPILLDVHVGFYSSGLISISHAILPGTTGLLLVCSQDASQFTVDAIEATDRKFDLSDSFFLPVARPITKALAPVTDGVAIQNGAFKVHLHDNGECEILCTKLRTTALECASATIGGIPFATHSHDASTVLDGESRPCSGKVGVPS